MDKIKKVLKEMEESNLMAKILSLICAILLWFFVMNVVDPVTRRPLYKVPVKIEGLQDLRRRGLTLINQKEVYIDLELQGNRSYMDQVNESNIQASINLEGLSKGEQAVPIEVTNYNDNVRVVSQDPVTTVVNIDENTTITEKIDVKTLGDLPDGYIIGDISSSVKEVKVSGPKSLTDSVHSVIAYVNIKDRRETTVVSTQLSVYDAELNKIQGLEIEPGYVELEVPIYKTKTLPVVPQVTGRSSQGYDLDAIEIHPKTVTIKGNSAVVNSIKEVKTKPISWQKLEEGTLSTIELEKPEGVSIVNNDQIYQVGLREAQQEEKTLEISNPNIRFSNLSSGLQGQVLTSIDQLEVRLTGDAKRIEEINVENIRFYVDCQGLGEGDHTLQLKMTPVEGVHVLKIEPDQLKISLNKG